MKLQGSAALAGVLLCMAACGGGSGGFPSSSSIGRDDPGTTRDTPPATRDDTAGACIQCDVVYDCPDSPLGNGFSLSSSDGTCTAALIDLVCSGQLFEGSPCNAIGGGGFSCGSITCTPEVQSQPGGGSNSADAGVSGATPSG
jgi:hypothetical protein